MPSLRSTKGFTLIELMIAVAIVAILASIAYPSYREQIARSRRADAKAALLERAQWMERQVSVSGSYNTKAGGGTLDAGAVPALPTGTGALYTFSFAASSPTATAFTMQLVPKSGGAMANDKCGTLSVDNTGTRNASGTATYATCWEK